MLEYNLDIEKRSTWILATRAAGLPDLPFYITEIGRFFAGQGYFTRRSGKEGYYLVYTQVGRGLMHFGGGELELCPGQALLIPCEPLHDYRTVGEVWEHSWMHLNGAGVGAFCALLETRPVEMVEPRRFTRQFAALVALARQIDVAAAARISHGVSALLTDMVLESRLGEPGGDMAAHTGMEEALRYIEENYREPISIEDMARRVSLSKYHFVRLFRRYAGVTPYQYLLHYRVNQSKQLLCTTDSPVAEIAAGVGFPGESNYIRQFGRLTGMTPAQFRRANISYLE